MHRLWRPSGNAGRDREKEDNKPDVTAHIHDEWVAIREEGKEGIRELSDLLSERHFFQIALAPGCSTGKCGCRYLLLTAKTDDKHRTRLH